MRMVGAAAPAWAALTQFGTQCTIKPAEDSGRPSNTVGVGPRTPKTHDSVGAKPLGSALAMAKRTRTSGRDRRLRERLFAAGNTMCPICLSEFTRADVLAGTEVTLEHAPPKSLRGSAICLTCKRCNSKSSVIDQHALMSKKARDQWAAGQGAPITVDLFGHKKTHRYIPKDPEAPYPARKHLMRNGTIELGPLPGKDRLDADKGISFRIPQRDDYEFVSMVKSAYLMVFSLMGTNGYRWAKNIGLAPVREQIMNPDRKILKGRFVADIQLERQELSKLGMSVVFLCPSKPPFWIVPLWNDRAVILSCGAAEPIDELVIKGTEFSVPMSSLAGWVSGRFDGSASIAADLRCGPDILDGSLAGTIDGPFATSRGGWLYVWVFHQRQESVALPLCPEDGLPSGGGFHVVGMLSKQQAVGKNLDLAKMARVKRGSWGHRSP